MSVDAGMVRRLALGLPEVVEAPHHARTSFRVGGKIFATLPAEDDGTANLALPEQVAEAVSGGDEAVASPIVWGKVRGWVRLDLHRTTETQAADLLASAWSKVAPKRLLGARDIGTGR